MLVMQRGVRAMGMGLGSGMLDTVVAWGAVLFSAAAFGGFLFGLVSAVTLLERVVPSRLPVVRAQRAVRATPRLWA